MDSMRDIFISKVIVNIGIGSNEQLLPNVKALLKKLTGREGTATHSKKRDPSLKVRKGQIIGAMVTLRKTEALDVLKRTLDANESKIKPSAIANNSLNFGIKEYIDISGMKYDPKIGMFGMNVNASFARKGARVELRKRKRTKADVRHKRITNSEIAEYMKKNFNVSLATEE